MCLRGRVLFDHAIRKEGEEGAARSKKILHTVWIILKIWIFLFVYYWFLELGNDINILFSRSIHVHSLPGKNRSNQKYNPDYVNCWDGRTGFQEEKFLRPCFIEKGETLRIFEDSKRKRKRKIMIKIWKWRTGKKEWEKRWSAEKKRTIMRKERVIWSLVYGLIGIWITEEDHFHWNTRFSENFFWILFWFSCFIALKLE